MRDILENLESAAERWAEDNIKDGKFFCAGCEKWHDLDHGVPSTNSPYALPICMECAGIDDAQEKMVQDKQSTDRHGDSPNRVREDDSV